MRQGGHRRPANPAALVLVALALGCGAPPKPSFLLYVVDTLRRDALGVHGAQHPTPHVDALAAGSLVFERAYAPSSWTRASMASLLTGQPPLVHGAERRADRLRGDLATLPVLLRDAGYATAFVTANPNAGTAFGFDRGFDTMIELYRPPAEGAVVSGADLVASSDAAVDRAIAWLAETDEPFFLAVLDVGPHHPYRPREEITANAARLAELTRALEAEGATPERVRQAAALARELYEGEVRATDRAFGRLLDALKEGGRFDRTLVVFTSDHGEEFFEHGRIGHGQSLYDEVLRVPLIVKPPALAEQQGDTLAGLDAPTSLVDLLPTALALLGVDPPDPNARRLGAPGPVTASLCLDGFHQVAVWDGSDKLLVDVAARRAALYEIEGDPGEQAPRRAPKRVLDLQRAIRDRLGRRAFRERDCVTASPELPADVRRALDALGYVE